MATSLLAPVNNHLQEQQEQTPWSPHLPGGWQKSLIFDEGVVTIPQSGCSPDSPLYTRGPLGCVAQINDPFRHRGNEKPHPNWMGVKYQVFLMKRLAHLGQVILILPLPLGTRTGWWHRGHSKYRWSRSFSLSRNIRNLRFSW